MSIKNRLEKKKLMQGIHACKERTSHVITVLRANPNLDRLTNVVIAQLNDLAFKGIQKGGLQKMIDKRAITNEDLYTKLDQEIQAIVKDMEMD